MLGAALTWFGNPPDEHHAVAADVLLEIWAQFPEVALALAQFSWVVDGITESEAGALAQIHHIASYDVTLVSQLLSIDWVVDGINENEAAYVNLIAATIGNQNAVSSVMGYSWAQDGVSVSEVESLEILQRVANAEPELVQAITNLGWIEDGFTEVERETLAHIGRIVDINQSLALQLTKYHWLQNGIDKDQKETLHGLAELVGINPEIAYRVANVPWLRDAETVTSHQWDAVYYLSVILRRDGWLGATLVDLISNSLGQLERDLILTLSSLLGEQSEAFARLRQQSWFADGLSRDEMAFLVTTRDIVEHSPQDFDEMIASRSTQAKSVNLPLSGDVNIWAIQKTPFPEGEDITGKIEDALLALEEITLTPLHTKDVVVLIVVHGPDSDFLFLGQLDAPWPGAAHAGSHVRMPRDPQNQEIELNALFHELSHYQFSMYPSWLLEGGASFAGRYMWYRNIERSFEPWYSVVDPYNSPGCHTGAINLHELGGGGFGHRILEHGICFYTMGEHFFVSLFHTLGREVVSKGLRDIFAIPAEQDRPVTSKDIFLAFKNHVPPDQEQRYLELFRVLHGGPLVGDWSGAQDIEGDTPETAVSIQTDALIEASLDHPFDVDYFTVSLAAGQTVLPLFTHDTETGEFGEGLRLSWFTPDDGKPQGITRLSGEAATMQERWSAAITGNYVFSIESTDGIVGKYKLKLFSAEEPIDQHGNAPDQASLIGPSETISGLMNNPTDRDVFKVQVTAGWTYQVDVVNQYISDTKVTAYESDGRTQVETNQMGYGVDYSYLMWAGKETADYYLVVESIYGNLGRYSITLTETNPTSDDHGDDHSSATLVQIGQRISAEVDPPLDIDYFKFRAEQGLSYNIIFDHLTIAYQPVTIFDSDGTTVVHEYGPWGGYDSRGTLIPWTPPRTDDYYIRFESPDGDTGKYSIVILSENAVQDEHADAPNSAATEINLNETVEGTLSQELDLDYFKVNVEVGENYFISLDYEGAVVNSPDPAPRATVYVGDNMTELFRAVREGKKEGGRYLNWLAHEPQIHYIVVWSPEGYVGEYTLIVETGASTAGSP